METLTKKAKAREKTNRREVTPARLSKAGQWLRDNPGGIIVVHDRRAVNK